MADHWVREVPCRDVAGRTRGLRVFVDGGTVVLFAPPGEAARLGPVELRSLQQVLMTASIEAAHRAAENVGD
jgi:hypothetical protein